MLRASWVASMLVVGLLASSAPAAEFGNENSWIRDDLPKALDQARKTGKPIFVVFRCER